VLRQAARFQQGIEPARAALAFADAKRAEANWQAESFRLLLGILQRGAGQSAEGLRNLQLAEARARALPGRESSERYAGILVTLALAEHAEGRTDDAELRAREARSIMQTKFGPLNEKALRVFAVHAWLQALTTAALPTAPANFEAAAAAYASSRPPPAALAELDLMRAAELARHGDKAKADALSTTAMTAWRTATGRDWPGSLVTLH